jgi:hypothetical protein
MATRILVAVVRNGAIEGGFDSVECPTMPVTVRAFKLHLLNTWDVDLLGVMPRLMTVHGPWASAAAVPEDVGAATSGVGHDAIDPFEPLVVGKERAYFLVRITTPPVAAGELGVELARHAWSVPTILVVRVIRHSECPSCILAHARQPLHHCHCTRVSDPSPLVSFCRPDRGRHGLGHGCTRERRKRSRRWCVFDTLPA